MHPDSTTNTRNERIKEKKKKTKKQDLKQSNGEILSVRARGGWIRPPGNSITRGSTVRAELVGVARTSSPRSDGSTTYFAKVRTQYANIPRDAGSHDCNRSARRPGEALDGYRILLAALHPFIIAL